jgi:hypothetical protein
VAGVVSSVDNGPLQRLSHAVGRIAVNPCQVSRALPAISHLLNAAVYIPRALYIRLHRLSLNWRRRHQFALINNWLTSDRSSLKYTEVVVLMALMPAAA